MTYQEALTYIHSINWTFCKPGLERINALCEVLGNPQQGLRFIHVAGTNGKGSFCAMIESILRGAGYKTGLFTSPYMKVFNERMMVDGVMIADDELAELTAYVRPFADAMEDKPTEFELITALAFLYFQRHGCDVVVLEAGMGGRLDSTNIIQQPFLSVITGVALDHTAFLGDTIEKIATEKAGIIKSGCPVLYGGEDKAAHDVVRRSAAAVGSAVHTVDYAHLTCTRATLEGSVFDFEGWRQMELSLLGTYQPRNAAVVLKAVEILREQGLPISEQAVRGGLQAVRWPGRFELLCAEPPIIFDGAHNAQGVRAAVAGVRQYFPGQKVYVLTGVLADKDYHAIAAALAEIACRAYVITPDNPRALPGEEYAALLRTHGVEAQAYESVRDAYRQAVAKSAGDNTPLVCLGSLYMYGSL
ncbi:MAG: bifunctional folylpolyglutamate synthase/dihydrofolate synthase [Clostridia bacterium]|nr:bifunctional folylpolyglutamate synthase/dihydrofolate synthase [Clostridia bacterium]